MKIREATPADLKTVISWIPDATACRTWAGPLVRFPLYPEDLAHDIEFGPGNSYCRVAAGDIIAFGQLIRKDAKRLHMARVIVAPEKRASGVGGEWCRALIGLARQQGCETISLNVYRDNAVALRLYAGAGFSEVVDKSTPDLCHMIAAGNPENQPECTDGGTCPPVAIT
jgi:ribosomal-protein-alanine N-acetyltransferase